MPSRRAVTVLLAALLSAAALVAAGSPSALAGVFSGTTIDGPSPDIVATGNVSLARDGTAGVSYIKQVGGVPHAFASTVSAGGAWSPPQQLDGGVAGSASQVAVAAAAASGRASMGRVVAVFIDGGQLYAALKDPGQAGFSSPQPLAGGASNASLSISTNGTAYVSFTASGPAGPGADVYLARLDRSSTTFSAYGAPLNFDPSRRAGYNAATRSQVATATDGQALVTWAEDNPDGHTHVIARRASLQGLSPAVQDLTLTSLTGQPGGAADSPFVDLRDAADFGWVVFRQTFFPGGAPESRTIARFERGSTFQPPAAVDPLSFPSADGAAHPQVGVDGTGDGLIAVGLTASHQVFGDPILDPASLDDPALGTPERLDSAPVNAVDPQPVTAIGGIDDNGALAWEQSGGATDPVSVHVRPFANSGFAAEGVISAAAFGPVDPVPGGLTGAADRYGDAFFAFVQGGAGARRVVIGGLANPPGDFNLSVPGATRQTRPVLSWTASTDLLGLAGYEVRIDGSAIAMVSGHRLQVPAPLADGPHRVLVVAVDRYGQRTPAPEHILRVDRRAPHPHLSITGSRRAGSALRFSVSPGDGPRSSGVGSARIDFGDGSRASSLHSTHTYGSSGGFTVRVTVRDRAGNSGTTSERIQIA